MKRLIIFIVILLPLLFSGCSMEMKNDRVEIITGDIWIFDDTTIDIPKDYTFKDFTKRHNKGKDALIITLNFEKKESEDNNE